MQYCSSDGGEGQTALSPPLTNLNEPLFEQQPTTRVRRLLKASDHGCRASSNARHSNPACRNLYPALRPTTRRVGRLLWPIPGTVCSRQHPHAHFPTYACTGERSLGPQGILVLGRARWHLQIRIGAPSHSLREPSLRTLTVGI